MTKLSWARNRFARFFRAFYTTSKPRKILPKQSSSNIFSWTKRSCSSALPGVRALGVCWSSYYHVRVRVFTELQNPEQNFYLVFWFLSDHRPNRTFNIYNSHWKKKILTWSKNDHEYCLYACACTSVHDMVYIYKTF